MSESDQANEEIIEAEQELVLSPGQRLKKIREELGYSEAKVAESLHMTARYVRALENDQYHILPGKTFVKGYFRAYAAFLNTDVEAFMKCYQEFSTALEETEQSEAKVIQAKKAYDQNKRWSICAAIIIIIVVGVSWWYK
jgi:cytoskeleton protein RodZ